MASSDNAKSIPEPNGSLKVPANGRAKLAAIALGSALAIFAFLAWAFSLASDERDLTSRARDVLGLGRRSLVITTTNVGVWSPGGEGPDQNPNDPDMPYISKARKTFPVKGTYAGNIEAAWLVPLDNQFRYAQFHELEPQIVGNTIALKIIGVGAGTAGTINFALFVAHRN